MAAQDTARLARINELCHRMTMSDARDVRVWLCAELKREIGSLLPVACLEVQGERVSVGGVA
ncbi:hypothetical protein QCE47_27985 [Caballeronia sp. LZ025]|uniref:hypothetical protein n=1 Tax=Caballeronia TaxID=1827195 RepID=UPI001FD5B31E|nr:MULTISPECIES: hypothetical protein [Caballeronia]MDR5736157.1 hypothetical protein [Caballeronia sp. LZ025]